MQELPLPHFYVSSLVNPHLLPICQSNSVKLACTLPTSFATSGLVCAANTKDDVMEGDARYLCMELLQETSEDLTKCDIFSLGCTLYEVVRHEKLPAEGSEWTALREGTLQPMDCIFELQHIVRSAMMKDPADRPTARALLDETPLLHSQVEQKLQQKEKELEQLKEGATNQIP